jgi:hypothetical protein
MENGAMSDKKSGGWDKERVLEPGRRERGG